MGKKDLLNIKIDRIWFITHKVRILKIIVALLMVWYGYAVVFKRNMNRIKDAQSQIKDIQAKSQILTKLAVYERDINRFKELLGEKVDLSSMVKRLSDMAKRAGLTIISLKTLDIRSEGDFLYGSVDIHMKGAYHQMGEFVSMVEGAKEFMRIERLKVRRKDKGILDIAMVVGTLAFR